MANGDITKTLVAQLRDDLRDWAYEIYQNDIQIINDLNSFQKLFMSKYRTAINTFEINFEKNKYFYDIDTKVKSIEEWFFSDGVKRNPVISYVQDPESVTKDNILRANFTNQPVDDNITAYYIATLKYTLPMSFTQDPQINSEFHPLLVDAVKSKHIDKFPQFSPLNMVILEVKSLSSSKFISQYHTVNDIGLINL